MNNAECKRAISKAWTAFRLTCEHHPSTYRLLDDALMASEEIETAHRRFMRASGRGYRLTVGECARLFVLKNTYEGGNGGAPPKSYRDCASLRRDVLKAYALNEALQDLPGAWREAFPRELIDPILTIEYHIDAVRE